MLALVRDGDTAQSLAAARVARRNALAELTVAPVRHVPVDFLRAVAGLFPEAAASLRDVSSAR